MSSNLLRRLSLAKQRRAQRSAAPVGGVPMAVSAPPAEALAAPPVLQSPQAFSLTRTMQEAEHKMVLDNSADNTTAALEPKKEEWFQFCDYLYKDEPTRHIVNADKAYTFMCYQMFREQKPRGGSRATRDSTNFFDPVDYEKVTKQFKKCGGNISSYPLPEKPVGWSTFNTYKCSLKQLFHEQQAQHGLLSSWEHVWLPCFDKLRDHVKLRVPKVKKANYEEKIDGSFAPYAAVEKLDDIEELLWKNGYVSGPRNVCCALRHRFCGLYLTSAVLRSESIYNAELSDFQGLQIDVNENDVHPIFCMIMQIPIGKTNRGQLRYGRGMRHKLVERCFIGGFSFYIMYRFQYSGEFADFTVEDWCDNKKWFDVKLLVDCNAADKTKKMQNDSYKDKIREVLKALNLPANKLLHLGRNLGSKILDMLEVPKDEKKAMGQWAMDVVDTSYSSKLPMFSMRRLAGFTQANGMHYNPRTMLEPPMSLARQTTMGRWCYQAYEGVAAAAQAAKGASEHQTALGVLKLFCYLNMVFLQDAAAMLVVHPERSLHPMFKDFAVLRSDEFKVSRHWFIGAKKELLMSLYRLSLFCTPDL